MISSWLELEKGDIIHSLIFNPRTTCYQYQEIKLINAKLSSTSNSITLIYKYSRVPDGKRLRVKVVIYNVENKFKVLSGDRENKLDISAIRYGTPTLISLTKEDLESCLEYLKNEFEKNFRLELSQRFAYLNYFINYVKNQNPLQS